MQGAGYWIDPDGQIERLPGGRHIDQMITNPERFGLTRAEIVQRYEQAGEPLGLEGRARRALILEAIERGFIHIRLTVNRGWLVSLSHLGADQQSALRRWALAARQERWAGEHTPLFIDCKADGTTHRTTIGTMIGDYDG